MTKNTRIRIDDFSEKDLHTKLIKISPEYKAILTHYIHNLHCDLSDHYKPKIDAILETFISHKESKGEHISSSSVIKSLSSQVKKIPFPTPKSPKFSFIDLFAGIGGFRIAMQNAGCRCTFSSEIDEMAKLTYFTNFGEIPFGDITQQYVKDYIPKNFDILCAGFPCQAFSIAGYRKGFSDTRGTLFFDLEQIIEKHRPKVVFLENVKNLKTHDKGKTFKVILEILHDKLGYTVYHDVLNTMKYADVPQNRERIFIVAFDPKQVENHNKFSFPKEKKLKKTIHDILDQEKQEEKYYYPATHKYYPELQNTMKNKNTVYQWRRVYVRENKNNVCPTLTANMGGGGHNVPLIKDNWGIRKLTPKECFAFQGYPMNKYLFPKISDTRLYMQAGNSVTTTLIERISREIIRVL